jgi:hypothetical protein
LCIFALPAVAQVQVSVPTFRNDNAGTGLDCARRRWSRWSSAHPATYTIYFVAFTKETASDGTVSYVHRLHALDIRSGKELAGSPVEIQASVAGTGDGGTTVTFVPESYKQRAALLQRVAIYNVTPNGLGASFWGAGDGPAADSSGNLFIVSANGTFSGSEGGTDLGDSIIKLSPAGGLTVTDYFTPFNQLYLSDNDLDLGSSGALLLPPEAGSTAQSQMQRQIGHSSTISDVSHWPASGCLETAP